MRIIDVEQGSHEWLFARAGVFCSSSAHRLLTPKKLDLSTSAQDYAMDLALERHLGAPLTMDRLSEWMVRGQQLEDAARDYYEAMMGMSVEVPKFYKHDTLEAGASTDGLVDGGRIVLEIKARNAAQHWKSVKGAREIAPRLQVQTELWVTKAEACDVLAYNPSLPCRIQRVFPEPEVQDALTELVPIFLAGVDKEVRALGAAGACIIDHELDGELVELVAALYSPDDDGKTQLQRDLEASLKATR